jgi:hypothetical protein
MAFIKHYDYQKSAGIHTCDDDLTPTVMDVEYSPGLKWTTFFNLWQPVSVKGFSGVLCLCPPLPINLFRSEQGVVC